MAALVVTAPQQAWRRSPQRSTTTIWPGSAMESASTSAMPSSPGSRTVSAGPAMRIPELTDWIAGTMKPSDRKWPSVAVSTVA